MIYYLQGESRCFENKLQRHVNLIYSSIKALEVLDP